MRRAQPRPSRNERIIHGSDGAASAAGARTRVPRGQAKIRSLDDGNRDAVHAFEDSLRRNWAADVGVGVGADVAEAAAARGFPHLSVFRPGMLDRGLPPRAAAEWLAYRLLPTTHMADVARAMIAAAKRNAGAPPAPTALYEL